MDPDRRSDAPLYFIKMHGRDKVRNMLIFIRGKRRKKESRFLTGQTCNVFGFCIA